jgi:arylsulfatase A-like enzyme
MLLSVAFLAAALPLQGVLPQPTSRANVLIVVADDLGVDMVGAYGEGSAPPATPVIDGLAAQGVLFRNVWSNPVCSPTRAALLTGRPAFRTGIGFIVDAAPDNLALPLSEITLPEMLALGTGGKYRSAAFGKWHLGNEAVGGALAPNLAGFDHFAGALSNFYAPESYTNWTRVVDGAVSQSTVYATTDTVDSALAWLADAPEPWLCYVAFNAPHYPVHAPPAGLHSVDLTQAGPLSEDPAPYYRAMVQALDTELGRLLAGVAPPKLARTTVVFLGDNGTPGEVVSRPFPSDHAKGTLHEGGINVPLIVTGPRVQVPGSESLGLVSITDVFATVAELAKVDLDQTLPGLPLDSRSLLPYLKDPATPSLRKTVFSELFHPNGEPALVPAVGADKPADFLCQPDLGSGSPAGPVLTLCGAPLYGGQSSTLRLEGAPPGAAALLFTSGVSAPLAAAGGALVPSLGPQIYLFSTDAAGAHTVQIQGGKGEATLYYQMVVAQAGQFPPFTLSNALQVAMHGTDFKAIRDARFKLLLNAHTGARRFYDLQLDPFERDDLLAGPALSPLAKQHLAQLQHELMTMLWHKERPDTKGSVAAAP